VHQPSIDRVVDAVDVHMQRAMVILNTLASGSDLRQTLYVKPFLICTQKTMLQSVFWLFSEDK